WNSATDALGSATNSGPSISTAGAWRPLGCGSPPLPGAFLRPASAPPWGSNRKHLAQKQFSLEAVVSAVALLPQRAAPPAPGLPMGGFSPDDGATRRPSLDHTALAGTIRDRQVTERCSVCYF